MRTTGQIRRKLAAEVRGGSMAETVTRLLVIYDAFQDLEHLLESDWRVEYDDDTGGLYLMRRKDGLRTRTVYADSAYEIVSALLDELNELEYLEFSVQADNEARELVKVRLPVGGR